MPQPVDTQESFDNTLGKSQCLCVHFGAEWCPPCKELDAALTEMETEFTGVTFVSVDAEKLEGLAEAQGVESVPHVVFFKDGKKCGEVSGAKMAEIRAALRSMTAVELDPSRPIEERLKALTSRSNVMLFMKGNPEAPKCGFSRQTIELLNETGVPYDSFDILSNEEVRQELKKFSNWPTYPQLYVKGELVGGLDVLKELKDEGELADTLRGEA